MSDPLNIIIACGGTGGHLFPGIAVAQQLKAMGHRPVLLISRKEVDADASKKYGDLEFHTIAAIAKPKLLSWRTPVFLWKLMRTYCMCKKLIKRNRAHAVLGMGGFTSLPPVRAGRMLGLQTFVHDSNALPGKSNRMTARWCTRVLLGLKEAESYFPHSDCVVTGTPVREELLQLPSQADARQQLGLPQDKPVILVVGGSQGAGKLNSLLVEAAKGDDAAHYFIIAGKQDHARVAEAAAGAPNISVVGFCANMPAAYAAADGVVARAGASTLTELSVIGKAALLVPYPFAADDHQTHNARVFTATGAAAMCQQAELTPEYVRHFVRNSILNATTRQTMEHAMRAMARPDAARAIAETVTQ